MSSFQKKLKSLHISCGVGATERRESSDEIREISLWFIIKTKDSTAETVQDDGGG
jgi:hypothetical protein